MSTRGLAAFSSHHPKTVFAVWAVVIGICMVLASVVLPGVLTNDQDFTNNPESQQGADLLREAGLAGERTHQETIVLRSTQYTVDDPAYAEFAQGLIEEVMALAPETVEGAVGFHVTGDEAFVSEDRHITIIPVQLAGPASDTGAQAGRLHAAVDESRDAAGFEIFVTGNATINEAFQEISETDLIKGESIGVGVALIILLAVFGTVVSALVPVLMAIVAITVAVGLSALVGMYMFDLSFFVTNMITMMGLALGIDYSLFIVSRYREEVAGGRDRMDAIQVAGATASRAVFFSGITVVLALVGMLLIPTTIFRSLGAGAILVALVSVLAALTLLPAVLSVLGRHIERFRVRPRSTRRPDDPGGFWDWMTHRVMDRPLISLLLAAGILVAATVPFFSINTGQLGIDSLPDGLEAKEGALILQEEFGDTGSRATVVISGDAAGEAVQGAVERLEALLDTDDGFVRPFAYRTDESDRVGELVVGLPGDAVAPDAVDAVRRLRAEHIPSAFAGTNAVTYVTGSTAGTVDFFDLVNEYTPIVFGFVLALAFVLLAVVFRSIAIPIKSIILNLLSVGAAYGLMVLVTQEGIGASLFGFQQSAVVDAWIPLFLFTVLFGLSMDYHVFLLSRVRERFDQTGRSTESVAFGLRTTAGLITGAALIMVAVFGGFASGSLVMFQQMGFGLAVAVLIDATIVRSVLVPAAMKLMGDWNWWFPSFLNWVPRVGIEGEPIHVPGEAVPAGASE